MFFQRCPLTFGSTAEEFAVSVSGDAPAGAAVGSHAHAGSTSQTEFAFTLRELG